MIYSNTLRMKIFDGILFAADIEKAFESVDHNFIYASLKGLGLEKTLLNGLKPYLKIVRAVS